MELFSGFFGKMFSSIIELCYVQNVVTYHGRNDSVALSVGVCNLHLCRLEFFI